MLNLIAQAQKSITAANLPPELQGKAMELMAAETLAFTLPLPVEKVENPQLYFTTQYKVELLQKLAIINEQVVINLDATISLLYDVWLIRYMLVHTPGWLGANSFINLAIQQATTVPEEYKALVTNYPQLKNPAFFTDLNKELY
jgi:hypothetical protein